MNVTSEGGMRMVLKNGVLSSYFAGLLCLLVGFALGYVFLHDPSVVPLVVGVVLAFAGAFLILTAKAVTVVLDKGMGKAEFSFKSLIKNESRQMELADITDLVLKKTVSTHSSSKGGSSTTYQYILTFNFKNGESVPLGFGSASASIMNVLASPDEKEFNKAKGVADFLGVAIRFDKPPSAMDVLSAIKDGIAGRMDKYEKPQ